MISPQEMLDESLRLLGRTMVVNTVLVRRNQELEAVLAGYAADELIHRLTEEKQSIVQDEVKDEVDGLSS